MLRVRGDYDPSRVRLDRYEAFLDALCADREYQKDAIRTVCRFLAGGEYATTEELAAENYESNPLLGDRYGSLDGLLGAIPFPNKLACNVDLATATGKSWVMYGVAQVLLAEGVVDRVLVLCPSLTIESGLKTKFKRLSSDRTLRDLLPRDAAFRSPEIVDASVTTSPGDICVENIHSTYAHVRSSVRDSFGAGRGASTLVLNDEAHHVYAPTGSRSIRRWKEFLDSDEYDFRLIAGFSGTCYVGNTYFPDVVYQYSLRRALEDGRVKEIRYVAKDENLNQDERFQKYLERHGDNRKAHRGLKPLSIIVTGSIAGAKNLAEQFIGFLASELGISKEAASGQVLVVTSAKEHRANVAKLQYVDRKDDPTEWIFSVSMLTEGWDVQNVFQIVPHEQRAFNSKLLISQVLGRGLRVPPRLVRPAVYVFNHSNWSHAVEDLVNEVLEQERRLYAYSVTVGEHAKHHFRLHNLRYTTHTKGRELKRKKADDQVQLFKRGFVNFESQPVELERTTVFEGAIDHREYLQRTKVHYAAHPVDEVVQRLFARLKSIDAEGSTSYARDYPRKKLREIVHASLARIDEARELVSEQNLQHLYRAMGNTQRKVARTVRIELEPDQLFEVDTRDLPRRSVALGSFRKEATVFHDSESETLSEDGDLRALEEILGDGSTYPRSADVEIGNKFDFKSPVNVVLTTHAPEREFTRKLFTSGVADCLDSWIKAPDVGFYEISYSWRKGDHTKQARFNPDYFLKLKDAPDVLVVELKADDDLSDENRAKLRFALEHFERVNELQDEAVYHMKFVSPRSFDQFFQALKKGASSTFESSLQAKLRALLP
jgi:type III restriction enzyme